MPRRIRPRGGNPVEARPVRQRGRGILQPGFQIVQGCGHLGSAKARRGLYEDRRRGLTDGAGVGTHADLLDPA